MGRLFLICDRDAGEREVGLKIKEENELKHANPGCVLPSCRMEIKPVF